MSADLFDARIQPDTAAPAFAPSESLRNWLVMGMAALAIDLVLAIAATVLEFKHWNQDGFTPDVVLNFVRILPTACVYLAYLALAREIADRGLWKSGAGLFTSYLVLNILLFALEDLPRPWAIACDAAAAVGLIGLLVFSLSKRPRMGVQPQTADETAAVAADTEESESSGCLIHICLGLGVLAFKALARQGLPNFNLGLDDWTVVLGAVGLLFAVSYAVWFAVAKIRLRHQLGGLAAAVGFVELLVLLLNAGALIVGFGLLAAEVVNNPQLDEDGIDKVADPWFLQASVALTAGHVVWIVLTIALFAALWLRPQDDWSAGFAATK